MKAAPYFSRDRHLQQIMETHRSVILLSGHTHFSFNCSHGCVDMDSERDSLYINCGSIRPTAFKPDEPLQPRKPPGRYVEVVDTGSLITNEREL